MSTTPLTMVSPAEMLALCILGVVLGVMQVALGVNTMLVNLSRIGVFTMMT